MTDTFHNKFQKFIAHHLNDDQRKAVVPRAGIFLVRAGAGSGKTRVITARIIHLLLEHQAPSTSIVALTFTNKAAQEMRERVIHALPPNIKPPVVSTFHSYGLQLLKQYSTLIGLPKFSIMDSDDREKLLQTIIKRHNVAKRITASAMGSVISRHKNSITSFHTAATRANWGDPLYHQVWYEYEKERKAARCLDFDDILLETLRLFETQATFKETVQRKVHHVLVDEYQDTNKLQHALIQHMSYRDDASCSLESLCVVGDENQAIYSWRGATVDNMTQFEEHFPGTKIVSITQNYRSVEPILETAYKVIAHNKQHATHKIWSGKAARHRVLFVTCTNAYQEAELLALCGSHFQKTGTLSRLAVLYRSHFQSRALEEALVRNSIPYVIIGGTQFYDRQEIKDILAYLRLSHNPFDRISFGRCINTPSRTLGDAFLEQFMELWNSSPDYSVFETAREICTTDALTPRKKEALSSFIKIIEQISAASTVRLALATAIDKTAFFPHLLKSYDPEEAQERIANVQELSNAVAAMEERGITTISAFLDEVALVQDNRVRTENTTEVVKLMTLHSAKGLEFDTVMIAGLEDGIFPSLQSTYSETSLEEERRLLYVGITRARERLLMTCALSRFLFGTLRDQRPSRFVKELPPQHVQQLDTESSFFSQVQQKVDGWLQGTLPTQTPVQKKTPEKNINKVTHALHRNLRQSVEFDDPFADEVTPATIATTAPETPSSETTAWRPRQKVYHATFGEGVIRTIETYPPTTYLIIEFSSGLKKIAASYVKRL